MLVMLKRSSIALGLLALTAPVLAAPPSRNQTTADSVASALQSVSGMARSQIEIEAREGLVILAGAVPSEVTKAEALVRAERVPGVVRVVDRLRVAGDGRVRQAQYQPGMPPEGLAQPSPGVEPTQIAMHGLFHHNRGGDGAVYDGVPMEDAGAIPYTGPMPEGPAGSGGTQAAMPGNPNYAWPSYAPYPNFSAVGYPTVYPWQAWPNIGPFYPYPEVPLDWRAVTLRWDDGLWWLDFRKHYTRPFFTPYPFGLFAY